MKRYEVPRVIFINKLDRYGSDPLFAGPLRAYIQKGLRLLGLGADPEEARRGRLINAYKCDEMRFDGF